MNKKPYQKPTQRVVLIKTHCQLLQSSPATVTTKFSDDEDYDDWTPGGR